MDGRRIIAARKAIGMSQQDLADALETSQATIHRYETGNRDPKSGVVVKLAAALGVTVSYLLGASDDMYETKIGDGDPALTELVETYDALSDEGRGALVATARGLLAAYPREKVPARVARSA